MGRLFLALLVTFAALANRSARAAEKPLIVLVPGFFNSLVLNEKDPIDGFIPYFSADVVKTLRQRAEVVVVDSLSPLGTIETNGDRLERFLMVTADRFPGRQMTLIAHSAGGLYAMRALTNRPTLPVSIVVTMATPYNGIELIENIANDLPFVETLAKYLRLESLREFRTERMTRLMESFVIPDGVRWITIAGSQQPCHLLDCARAERLSWLLTLAQKFISEPSDGVVTVSSALARETRVSTRAGGLLNLEAWSDFTFPLEHWEMVEDYRYFALLGVMNLERIRDLQVQTYDNLLDRLAWPISRPSDQHPKSLSRRAL